MPQAILTNPESIKSQIELLEDIQTSMKQLTEGQGIENAEAKNIVLTRLQK